MAEAGWYPDPQDPQSLQYFDGQNWTGTRRPAAGVSGAPGPSNESSEPTTQNPKWAATQPSWSSSQPSQQPSNEPTRQHPQSPQGYGQSQQPRQSQWGQQSAWGAGSSSQSPSGPPPQWGGTPQKSKSKKTPVIIAAAVVVAALVAVLAFVLFKGGSDDPSITYGGKAIANADETLAKAESSLAQVVTRRHGAKSADTRCYFVQPEQPDDGQKKSDIQSSLRCGPVLFVDGNKANEYVAVSLSGTTSGSKAMLTASDVANDVTPAKLDGGVKLVRPDDKTPPSGDGGLSVPTPPAGETDVLTVATLDSSVAPKQITGAVMVGLTTKVTITGAGFITRYGTGDDARSAPSGQRLLAFQVTYGPGEGSANSSVKATLNVDGKNKPLPLNTGSDGWIVAAVPTSSTPVLQLTDGGFTQTLSLPDGKPGANNAKVLLRKNTTAVLSELFSVPVRVSNSSNSVKVTLTARATSANLSFWPPGHESVHASSGSKAILFVRVNYTEPGKTAVFGFDPQLLRLRLPSGQVVNARNIANESDKVFNVFEVPADFTTGRLEVAGSERVGNVRITIAAVRGFTVSIPAG